MCMYWAMCGSIFYLRHRMFWCQNHKLHGSIRCFIEEIKGFTIRPGSFELGAFTYDRYWPSAPLPLYYPVVAANVAWGGAGEAAQNIASCVDSYSSCSHYLHLLGPHLSNELRKSERGAFSLFSVLCSDSLFVLSAMYNGVYTAVVVAVVAYGWFLVCSWDIYLRKIPSFGKIASFHDRLLP